LQNIALVAIIACAAGRCFLGEMPFRLSALGTAISAGANPQDQVPVDRTEVSRAAFAVALLGAAALWALGGALRGRMTIRRTGLGMLILAFAAASLLSVLYASDKRSAILVAVEQVSLLAAGFVMAQLCRDRGRFALVVMVLAGLGMALAVKGLEQRLWTGGETRMATLQAYVDPDVLVTSARPDSPEAKMFASRARDPAPFGFFFLANLFGSVLVILALAAAGLAGDKIRAAARSLRDNRPARAKGEVDLPALAAAVAAGGAALVAVVLLLTESRGAILAALVAASAGALAAIFGKRLAARRRALLGAAAAAALLAGAAVVSYGLTTGRLPTKTMAFRWLYWTGSAKIVAANPALGVGGGNFPAAYLAHRDAGAEEAVKTPHNFIMHALVQFGAAGGALYIVIVAVVVVGMSRPPKYPGALEPPADYPAPSAPVVIGAVAGTALAARLLLFDWLGEWVLLLLEVAAPAIVLLVCLVAAWWAGAAPSGPTGADCRLSRIALCCGAAGLVVHNLVTFSLWAPAAGLVFWATGGACLARAGGGWNRQFGRSRWFLAAGCVGAVFAAGALVLRPALAKASHVEAAVRYLAKGNADAAVRSAELAAEADPLDAIAAADAAKMILAGMGTATPDRAAMRLRRARYWAEQAVNRDPARGMHHGLAGRIVWQQAAPRDGLYAAGPIAERALQYIARSVELDPMSSRRRVLFARMLVAANRPREASAQLDAAEAIDAALFPNSVYALNPRERQEIELLKAKLRTPDMK